MSVDMSMNDPAGRYWSVEIQDTAEALCKAILSGRRAGMTQDRIAVHIGAGLGIHPGLCRFIAKHAKDAE